MADRERVFEGPFEDRLRGARRAKTPTVRFGTDLGEEVTGNSLRGDRRGLPLDPKVELLEVSEGHYSSSVLVCARNSSRVSNGAGSFVPSRRSDCSR
jgi:hypothetical protein